MAKKIRQNYVISLYPLGHDKPNNNWLLSVSTAEPVTSL